MNQISEVKSTVRTNLEMDQRLSDRIGIQGMIDKRRFKAEILVLIEEALDRREKKR